MSVWKQVGQNLAGLAQHVVKRVVAEPIEVIKDAVGQKIEQGQQTQAQSDDPTQNPVGDSAKAGFKTQEDFQKYQGLSGQKDQVELEIIRKNLVREWGLDANIESGMQKARMEYEQKEKQRNEIKEKEKEQKKEFEFQKKAQEDLALKAATEASNPENKAWGAG